MGAGKHDLKLEQKSVFQSKLVFTDAAGDPFDFNMAPGWTAEAQIRKYAGDPDALVSITTSFSPNVSSQPVGELVLDLSIASIENLPLTINHDPIRKTSRFAWDLYLTDTLGARKRYLEGTVEVSPAVTRD